MAQKHLNLYVKIALAILVIAIVILCVFLVRQYRMAVRQGVISAERVHFADLIHSHSLGVADAGLIESWMTFNYVSISFKVPVSYFVTALGISSSTSRYPNITLGHYARMIATSSDAVTEEVRDTVRNYLSPSGK